MIGLIAGDFFGSIHENIPNQKTKIKTPQLTDDSFLALAASDWMKTIDLVKFKHLHNKNNQYSNKDYILFCGELERMAIEKLIKWHSIGTDYFKSKGSTISPFSPGFESWVVTKKNNIKTSTQSRNTNGCIMRNGPIPELSLTFNLSLAQAIDLSIIFAKTTHNHPECIEAVRKHTALVYFSKQSVLNRYNIKQALTSDDYSLLSLKSPIVFSTLNIKPIEHWIGEANNGKFIWDAKTSLDISCSSLYYSDNFLDVLDFCNSTNMDCDTYGAIAGAIAEHIFDIPKSIQATIQEELSLFSVHH